MKWSLKLALALAFCGFLSVPVHACTVFVLTDAHRALFCNNEDWSKTKGDPGGGKIVWPVCFSDLGGSPRGRRHAQLSVSCVIQSSTNLADWASFSTNSIWDSPVRDLNAPSSSYRFYRAIDSAP